MEQPPDAGPWADLARPPLRVGPLRRALVVPGGVWTSLDVLAATELTTHADIEMLAECLHAALSEDAQ